MLAAHGSRAMTPLEKLSGKIVGWFSIGFGVLLGAIGLILWPLAIIVQLPPTSRTMEDVTFAPPVITIIFFAIGVVFFIAGLVLLLMSYREAVSSQPPDEPVEQFKKLPAILLFGVILVMGILVILTIGVCAFVI